MLKPKEHERLVKHVPIHSNTHDVSVDQFFFLNFCSRGVTGLLQLDSRVYIRTCVFVFNSLAAVSFFERGD